MTKYILSYAISLISLMLLITSCDNSEDDTRTLIYGKITIDNADTWDTWQDSGEVQLTLFPEFSLDPPAGWGSVPDNFFGPGVLGGTFAIGAPYNSQNPLILTYVSGQTEYDYELEVDPGTYSALALGFRNDSVNDPARKTATLGVHWQDVNTVSHGVVIKVQAGPSTMTIFDYDPPSSIDIMMGQQLEINFQANFDFVNDWYQ